MDGEVYRLPRERLGALVERLAREYRVLGPIRRGDSVAWGDVRPDTVLALDYATTMLPPRQFFAPQSEVLFRFRRGADGGYYLARLPETITVGQVLRFIDGPAQKKKVPQREAPFSELWRKVDRNVAEIMERSDLASIVRDWAEKQRSRTYDWDI